MRLEDDDWTMEKLCDDAEKEFREWLDSEGKDADSSDIGDRIREIADDCVPSYNTDRLAVLYSDLYLLYEDFEPASDIATAAGIVILNRIIEHLDKVLEAWRDEQWDEEEEDDEEVEDADANTADAA